MTLTLAGSGGTYDLYLGALSEGLEQYYALEITDPTFTPKGCQAQAQIVESVAGSVSVLAKVQVPCRNGITYHAVLAPKDQILVYADKALLLEVTAKTSFSGQPGVGGRNIPVGNGIAGMQVGGISQAGPRFDNPQRIEVSAGATSAQFRWPGANDEMGVGVGSYSIYRDRAYVGRTAAPEYTDSGLSPATKYSYSIQAFNLHGHPGQALTFELTTGTAASKLIPPPSLRKPSSPVLDILCGDGCDPGPDPVPPPPPSPTETVTYRCSTALKYRPVSRTDSLLGLVNHSYLYGTWWSYVHWSCCSPDYVVTEYDLTEGRPEFGSIELNIWLQPWGRLTANIESNYSEPVFTSDPTDFIETDPQAGIAYESNSDVGCPIEQGTQWDAIALDFQYPYNPVPALGPGENSNFFAWHAITYGGHTYLGTPPYAPGFPGSPMPPIFLTYPVF